MSTTATTAHQASVHRTAEIAADIAALTGCSERAALCAAGSFVNFKPGYDDDHGLDPMCAPAGSFEMWMEARRALRAWKASQVAPAQRVAA